MEYTPKITANTATNTPISIKNAKAQREPAGRCVVGGRGVCCCVASVVSGTGRSGFGQRELPAGGIEVENFRIAPPLDRRFQLPLRFVFAEMLIEQILKELGG